MNPTTVNTASRLPHPILLCCPEHRLWVPCFIHWTCTGHLFYICNIHVSVLIFQIIPPLPSPTESKTLFFTSVFFCCLAYRIVITVFLNSIYKHSVHFSLVTQSCLTFHDPWTRALQASLSITNSWSLPKLMSIESVMPSNHLFLCHPRLLPPSIFPNIRVFANESALNIRWPKY